MPGNLASEVKGPFGSEGVHVGSRCREQGRTAKVAAVEVRRTGHAVHVVPRQEAEGQSRPNTRVLGW